MRHVAASVLLVIGLGTWFASAAEPAPIPSGEGPVTLPVTIEKVWAKSPGRLLVKGGDLIVSEDGLEFIFGKRNVAYSMDEIYILSYGQLRGDVDTEWALVGIGDDGPAEVIGIRDGKRLGYGQRTDEIHDLLLRVFRQQRAGQYEVPPGFRAYDVIPKHGSLAIPENWHAYSDRLVVDSEGRTWGTIIFSVEKLTPPTRGDDPLGPLLEDPNLKRIAAGEIPAFYLSLLRAGTQMSCDEIPSKAAESWLATGQHDPLARFAPPDAAPPRSEPARVAFCNGLRVHSTSQREQGQRVISEAYVAANHDTLFVLGYHAQEGREAAWREPFQTALRTLRFSVAY